MAKEMRACIECETVFEAFGPDVWICNECQVKATDRRGTGGTERAEIERLLRLPAKRWKAEGASEAMVELLRYLKLSARDQFKEGRTARFSAHRGKKQPEELPTCSRCGALAVLEPCRACSPPTSGPDDLAHWHASMRRTKAKRPR